MFVIPANAGIQAAAEKRETRVPRVREDGQDEQGGFWPPKRTKPIGKRYYNCPFQSHCGPGQPSPPDYPLGCLPRLSGQRLQGLVDRGIADVRDIPADTPLTPRQARVARVIQSGAVERDPAAAVLLKRLTYPRYYLDFESMQVAVPPWVGTRPYQ